MKRQFRNREPFRDPRCKNNSNDDSVRFLSLFSVQQFNGNKLPDSDSILYNIWMLNL